MNLLVPGASLVKRFYSKHLEISTSLLQTNFEKRAFLREDRSKADLLQVCGALGRPLAGEDGRDRKFVSGIS